ncbi:SusC/RagA family TonB-linked outer membrane protein [Pedobacter sp. MC2016-05]|jgi:TonB-linked SusC/RagA family outer membrane protein|uniref:SusC/RagA family TonB-linked outer membrane protein n=1 Tax=Pedobacter sp. MC2016-05 TaxID=2994474 RepID=UPI00224837C7|nr:SusC/RagA family TonB-linked outer membrane protein [Pedobacter sp. MC2016-05]MCX2476867.1 SusC/RagA family TonB-linked outer membrane protein [Pedobacter sp. MC2016-05]
MRFNFTSIKYGGFLLLFLLIGQSFNMAFAQTERKISGNLIDNTKQPIIGASVSVKGTSKVTSTGAEGSFTISAKTGDKILFSFLGYQTKELTVEAASTYQVTISEATASLTDVVVVGYGKSTRKALTSSISTVKGEDLNKGAISDVGQMLQGKVPGLNISRSGDPNRNAAIIMRGASTLREGAQSPLFVIDGVVGADISIIAPDDVASIDVLKDAAAAAIYGNRAANGVIMVTTKKGVSGQTQISYNGYFGIENVSNRYDMMNADQLRAFLAKTNSALTPANDKGANTNWQDEVQRSDAMSQNHNVSLSGGTEKTTYNASVNYFNQQGIIKTSGLDRFIGRIGVEQKAFNDKLKISFNLSNSVSNADLVPYRNTILSQMLTYLPTAPVRNADGSYFDNLVQTSYYNPVSMLENAKENLKTKNILGNLSANLKLPFGFTYDVNVSYQNTQNVYGAFYNSIYTSRYNNVRNTPDPPANPTFVSLVGQNGVAVRNAYQNTNKIIETYLTWNKKFGDHDINAVVGYSYQQSLNNDGFQSTSTNFPVNEVGYNNLSLGNPYAVTDFRVDFNPGVTYQEILLISDFARVNYNYKNKYLLQGSIRRDGSNVFGINETWGYYPSVGAAWNLDQENFMKNQNVVRSLKLRGSYGIAGNSLGFAPLTTKLIYGQVGQFYYNGSPREGAYGAIQNENKDLRWERTATTNLGVDFGLFGGRVGGSVDWYNKKTTDLILTFDVDQNLYPSGQLTANVGKLSNKGIEVVLNGTPVISDNFSWTTAINLARNVNKIITLSDTRFNIDNRLTVTPDGAGQSGASLQILAPGQAIGTFYTFKYAGKDANGVSQYYDAAGNIKTQGLLNRTDYYILGNAQPKALIGWSNNVRYKNFDLSIFMRAVLGNKIMNVTRADLFRPSTAQFTNIPVEVENESASDFNSYKYSSRFLENGSYLRLDNATLGYTFKKGLIPGVNSLRLYTTANNLFVITGYKGIDPEINQGGIAPGVDTNNFYPKTRTFLFGLNVSFN